jgi:hypothetical protein
MIVRSFVGVVLGMALIPFSAGANAAYGQTFSLANYFSSSGAGFSGANFAAPPPGIKRFGIQRLGLGIQRLWVQRLGLWIQQCGIRWLGLIRPLGLGIRRLEHGIPRLGLGLGIRRHELELGIWRLGLERGKVQCEMVHAELATLWT